MAKVYGYVRYSEDGRRKDLRRQQRQAVRFHEKVVGPRTGLRLDGFFQDTASTAGTPLSRRDAGAALTSRLERGDSLIIPSAVRSFASIRDMADTVSWFHAKGVRVYLLDLKIDSASEAARDTLAQFVLFCRWHHRFHAAFREEAKARPRLEFLAQFYRGGAAPTGWKRVRLEDGTFDLVPWEQERDLVRTLLRFREELGHREQAITRKAREAKLVSPRSTTGQLISRRQVTRYLRDHAAALGDQPPKPVWAQWKKGLPEAERRKMAEQLCYDRPDRQV